MRRFFAEATPHIRRQQYRSAIWAQSRAQAELATGMARELGVEDGIPVLSAAPWYDAEPYHQKYYEKQAAPSERLCRRL